VVAKSPIFDDGEQFGKMGKIDRKTPAYKEDPGFANFKVGMAKRKCYLCGRTFPYDLTPYYDKGASVHICVSCHMGGKPPEPAKADPQTQTKLEDGEAKA
jgi:hypothetical protein